MAVVADVFDVVLIDADGEVVGTTTLQDAKIDVKVKESEVRGGKGNHLLGVLHSDRDITINLTDINFRYEWMAKQLGQSIQTGAGVAYAMPKWYEVEDNAGANVITLEQTPSSAASLAIYDASGRKLALTTDYTVATNKVTIVDADIDAGDTLEVRTYTYATAADTQTIEFDGSVFAKGVKAVLETLEIDESTEEPMNKLQYHFEKALPTGNFTIETKSDKAASAQKFDLRVIKPKTDSAVGKVLRIPVA
jgi:hypothetical protein